MRKVLPLVGASLSAFALAWSAPAKAQDQAFKDLDPQHWAYQAVTDLQSKGILLGYPNGYFYGKRTLTRYEFAIAIQPLVLGSAVMARTKTRYELALRKEGSLDSRRQ
jgi:hypothetical protein